MISQRVSAPPIFLCHSITHDPRCHLPQPSSHHDGTSHAAYDVADHGDPHPLETRPSPETLAGSTGTQDPSASCTRVNPRSIAGRSVIECRSLQINPKSRYANPVTLYPAVSDLQRPCRANPVNRAWSGKPWKSWGIGVGG